MNAWAKQKMVEALELTRAGRLVEATSLLRGARPLASGGVTEAPASWTKSGSNRLIDTVRPTTKQGAWTARFDKPFGSPVPSQSTMQSRGGARGSFAFRTLTNEAGTRRYKLYLPAGPITGPLPLVLMLHGCTQSPDDFAAGTRMNEIADEMSVVVAYPEQPKSANSSKCWNWFKPADQRRDGSEAAIIADIVREIVRDVPVDQAKIFVAGLSAGGAQAAIMAREYSDLFAGACVHSGLACGAARDLPTALSAMRSGAPGSAGRGGAPRVPIIVFHGTADKTVDPSNAGHVLDAATVGLAPDVARGRSHSGVGYTRTAFRDESGRPCAELWMLEQAGHAWSGGSSAGSYTDPRGPDASREMMRFFMSL